MSDTKMYRLTLELSPKQLWAVQVALQNMASQATGDFRNIAFLYHQMFLDRGLSFEDAVARAEEIDAFCKKSLCHQSLPHNGRYALADKGVDDSARMSYQVYEVIAKSVLGLLGFEANSRWADCGIDEPRPVATIVAITKGDKA